MKPSGQIELKSGLTIFRNAIAVSTPKNKREVKLNHLITDESSR